MKILDKAKHLSKGAIIGSLILFAIGALISGANIAAGNTATGVKCFVFVTPPLALLGGAMGHLIQLAPD